VEARRCLVLKGGKEVISSKEGKEVPPAAVYSMPCWKNIPEQTPPSRGCNNVFGEDPPKEFGFELATPSAFRAAPMITWDGSGMPE